MLFSLLPDEMEVSYALLKGLYDAVYSILTTTFGTSEDPLGFIRLSKLMLVTVGFGVTLSSFVGMFVAVMELLEKAGIRY